VNKFSKVRDENGHGIPGLYTSEICRVERVDGLWKAQVTLRQIGVTPYYEFRPIASGGVWKSIGSYRAKDSAMHNAEHLVSGVFVWQVACVNEPGRMVEFKDVVEEIRASQ
jgi:L-lysine 2,3-aminomutase